MYCVAAADLQNTLKASIFLLAMLKASMGNGRKRRQGLQVMVQSVFWSKLPAISDATTTIRTSITDLNES